MKKCNLFYLSGLLFFLVAALNFLPARITLRRWYGSALAPPFCVWVLRSGKNKAFLQPRRWKNLAGAAILCGARSYSRQNDQISTKTRYVYVNQTDRFHCRDPL